MNSQKKGQGRAEPQLKSFNALLALFEGTEPVDLPKVRSAFSEFLSDRQEYYSYELNFFKTFLAKLDRDELEDAEAAQSEDFGLFKLMINGFTHTAVNHIFDFALFRILSMNVFSSTDSIDSIRQAIGSFAPYIQQLREQSQSAEVQEKQTKDAWDKLHAKPHDVVV